MRKELPVLNFALLQWRVVDVAAQCNLITIARRTRQTSSDKSATASNAGRYTQGDKNKIVTLQTGQKVHFDNSF
jgi:hypothetical protein